MGIQYDDTPSEEWMAAKVYAEYGVRLVNDFIRQTNNTDIPMPIVRAFGRNLDRAVGRLPKCSTPNDDLMRVKKEYEASMAPLMSVNNLVNGQLAGALPISKLAPALSLTKHIFAHVYAATTYEARFEMLVASNETTEKGFVGEWNSDKYDSPDEDPEAEITSWEEAKEQIYDENHGAGLYHWEKNETEIFVNLYFSGPASGHGGGSGGSGVCSVKTELSLLDLKHKKR